MILEGMNASPSCQDGGHCKWRVVDVAFRVREVVVPVGMILEGVDVSPSCPDDRHIRKVGTALTALNIPYIPQNILKHIK